MVVRLALAALLAGALLAVSAPAIDDGRAASTEIRVRDDLADLAAAAEALSAGSDPVPRGAGPARRYVVLDVPARTWTSAGATVALGSGDGPHDALTWETGARRGAVPVEAPLVAVRDGRTLADGRAIELGPGSHLLVLELVLLGDRPTVLVRTFKAEGATRPPHVRAVRRHRRLPLRAALRRPPTRSRQRRLSRTGRPRRGAGLSRDRRRGTRNA